MRTNESQSSGDRRLRRTHNDEFKADAIAAAVLPNLSMASLAMSLGINANLFRRRGREAEVSTNRLASKSLSVPLPSANWVAKHAGFVLVQLPAPPVLPAEFAAKHRNQNPSTTEAGSVNLQTLGSVSN